MRAGQNRAKQGLSHISHLPLCGIISPIHFYPLLLFQVLSAFQTQHTAAAAAAAAQPQLLIPLSSIPSYSAAMDTNPLLGSTYKKFPYPSMAEISSLAAQTQFTEEQIKVDESCFEEVTCANKVVLFNVFN